MSYLGEGTYGCAFRPALKCKNSANVHPSNTVGKVFDDEQEFRKEEKNYKLISNVNSRYEFTVPTFGSCDVATNSIDEACAVVSRDNNSYKQIIYRFGGVSLQNIIENEEGTTKRFLEIWRGLRPLLVGIKKLGAKGYIHGDIKLDNILLDGKRLNLIDFGLMTRPEDLFKLENFWILIGNNPFTPPEYRLYLESLPVTDFTEDKKWFAFPSWNHGRPRNIDNFADEASSNKSGFYDTKKGKLGMEDILVKDFYYSKEKMQQDLKEIYRVGFSKFFDIDKLSVISLGLVLAFLFVWAGKLEDNELSEEYQILIGNMIKFGNNRYSIDKVIEHYDMLAGWNTNSNATNIQKLTLSNGAKKRNTYKNMGNVTRNNANTKRNNVKSTASNQKKPGNNQKNPGKDTVTGPKKWWENYK